MRCIHWKIEGGNAVEASSSCFGGCFWCYKGFWNAVFPSTRKWFSVQSPDTWMVGVAVASGYQLLNPESYLHWLSPSLPLFLPPSLLPSFPSILLHFLLRTPLKNCGQNCILLYSAVPVTASWFSTFLVGTDVKASLVGGSATFWASSLET